MSRAVGPAIFLVAILVPVAAAAADAAATTVDPRRRAHAHNDYLHQRPLLDALDNGFGSVEADIFLVDGKLLVAHTRFELQQDRTLRGLYLDPLRARVQQNGGSVHGDGQPFTLLIDIKSRGEATYRALHKVLSDYESMLTSVTDGQVRPGAVTAVISGNRPLATVAADSPRYVGVDGRLSDLSKDYPAHLMPLVSDHWGRHFQWRGKSEMPEADRDKLRRVLDQAHASNRRIRFWATPDHATVWAALHQAGVDLINTDDLRGLANYLRSTQSQ